MRKHDSEVDLEGSSDLPWWLEGKIHDPIVLPRADGLTDDERWDLAGRAMEALTESGYDFEYFKRVREFERGTPYESTP